MSNKIMKYGYLGFFILFLPSICNARWFWEKEKPKPPRNSYVGASYGAFTLKGDKSYDDEDRFYLASIGRKASPYFGIEFSYAYFGKSENELYAVDFSGFSTSAIGYFPLGEYTQFYGKLGVMFSTLEIRSAAYQTSFHDEQPHIGMGLNFKINDPLTIYAEFNRYYIKIAEDELNGADVDNSFDVDAFNVGAKILF